MNTGNNNNNDTSFTTIDIWNTSTSDIEWQDPDNTYVCLDSDFSLTTDETKALSTISDNNSSDICEFSFNYDHNAFQRAQDAAYTFENNDDNADIDDYDNITTSNTSSSFVDSAEYSNTREEDYIIQDIPYENEIFQNLTKNNNQNNIDKSIPSLMAIKTAMQLGKIKIKKLEERFQLADLLIHNDQGKNLKKFLVKLYGTHVQV
ncbi:5273_t:CDS:2 [Scutellospora calospora]|uniref:5273_t:CDS:1 n=1 Tax=Scutellospora calospora TaxID=85575 RepID=A0ACA9M694_9GLOM|nr:5273_t:CDS:2 [Scutellospora calospora]